MSSVVRDRARAALGKTFHSLATRNFRLFFIGQLISNTGNQLTNLAVILFVLLSHSGLAVGTLTACQFGPMVVLSAWAGAVADRVDKRRALLVTQSLEMAQSVALAVLAFMPHPSIVVLYVLAMAGGVLLAFDNPLRRSFVPEMVSKDELPNAVVLYSTIVALSQVSGPALAGVLIATAGFGFCFALDAVTYVAVIACLIMMRERELLRQPPAARTGREVREGLGYVASVPRLWISFTMFACVGLFSFNLRVALPLLVTRSLHGTDVSVALLFSTMSVGAVVGTLGVAHRRLVELRHVLGSALAVGFGMLLLSLMPSVPAAVPVAFVMGAASMVYFTATSSVAQVDTRRDMRGRVLALQTALIGGTALVGGPIVGRLADLAGARAPIAIGAAVCLAAAALGELGRRHFRHAPG
ncbi:MAG TPA: MFS transporter [Polyangiaceae bacterium]|nr:MFS transporter [Polyangiaceae bacterium]